MNLGAGTCSTRSYTFSSPGLDLAIISLDQRNSRFANELVRLGYAPVTLDDIVNEPSREGAEIYTVGFPGATALMGQIKLDPEMTKWSSSDYSLPIYSYGRVSMLHEALHFFWGDISVYPGNSGGPVVENEKLVGIVSAQPVIPLGQAEDQTENLEMPIPFGKIIKAKFLPELFAIQEQKDANLKQ